MSISEMPSFVPFVLVTTSLILVPTPIAILLPEYRIMYSSLHADPKFCQMAFSHHFPPRKWSDAETLDSLRTRDVERCWNQRGMGDFAVGRRVVLAHPVLGSDSGRCIPGLMNDIRLLEGPQFHALELDLVEWIGYAGVRDATMTSMPPRLEDDPDLPPWLEMIELRYGLSPQNWGSGLARPAAEAVMQWAVSERGVRRFIAETEKENSRSGRVLEKLGFTKSETDYWKEPVRTLPVIRCPLP